MTEKVFISYRHVQGEWVQNRLAPVVRASGAEVILDVIDGKPGWSLDVQMKKWGDEAAHVLAVLSPDYFQSAACGLEWRQALARDPGFLNGGVLIPLLREDVDPLPAELQGTAGPLYLDLRRDGRSRADRTLEQEWVKLLDVWGGQLGGPVTRWLDALREVTRNMQDNKHVNLLAAAPAKWRELLEEADRQLSPDGMATVNVADPGNWQRADFLENILKALGVRATLDRSGPRSDIVGFAARVRALPPRRLAFKNLQKITDFPDFGHDLFDALRFHAMDDGRNLTLLVHTSESFGRLLPRGHLLSLMTATQVVLP